MPDLRSSTMNDTLPNQIPQNTTYETPFLQQSSPIALSPESITSQGKKQKRNSYLMVKNKRKICSNLSLRFLSKLIILFINGFVD